MKVQVLQVRFTPKGSRIAHIQAGQHFADCLATDDVTGPGEYWLKNTLRVQQGRLVCLVRVEQMPQGMK